MAENMTYEAALRSIQVTLQRELTEQEQAEVQALVNTGVTTEQWPDLLASINASGTGPLFSEQPQTIAPTPTPTPQPGEAPAPAGDDIFAGITEPSATGLNPLGAQIGVPTTVGDFDFNIRPPQTPVGVIAPKIGEGTVGVLSPEQIKRNAAIDALSKSSDDAARQAVTRSFSKFSSRFVNRSPQQIESWQRRLVAAGLLSDEELQRDRVGNAGVYTLGALAELAWEAHFAGSDLETQLQQRLSAAPASEMAALEASGEAQQNQMLISTYMTLWGTAPSIEWLEANKGRNIYEVEYEERARGAFKLTPTYQEERLGIDVGLAQQFGSTGIGVA